MIRPIRTYSEAWLRRHRETHTSHALFGTHRHPYLFDMVRQIALSLTEPEGERPSLLDYGCGKGVFLREIARAELFRYVRGFDPAVDAFKARPAQRYDLVVCLDVLDQLEAEFVEPVIRDVAQYAGRTALFDVITVQTEALAHLRPRSAATWREIIGRYMQVAELTVRSSTPEELQQGACPERAIIVATSLQQ
jgi:SAM-dependent methyltransferase